MASARKCVIVKTEEEALCCDSCWSQGAVLRLFDAESEAQPPTPGGLSKAC